MGPKASMSEENLYRYPLLEPITLKHLPVCLADPIDWDRLSAAMEDSFMSEREHPTTSQRLIAELLCWQVFTGETNLQNESPIGYRTLTRRRKRLGDAGVEELNSRAKRILSHKPKSKHKLYARYTSEVECLVKGGARKPDEFGVQVSITTTQKEGQVASVRSMRRNPYDGRTLAETLERAAILGELEPLVDQGYGGLTLPGATISYSCLRREITPTLRAMIKRRSAMESAIGDMTATGNLGRNWLRDQLWRCVERGAVRCRSLQRADDSETLRLRSILAAVMGENPVGYNAVSEQKELFRTDFVRPTQFCSRRYRNIKLQGSGYERGIARGGLEEDRMI